MPSLLCGGGPRKPESSGITVKCCTPSQTRLLRLSQESGRPRGTCDLLGILQRRCCGAGSGTTCPLLSTRLPGYCLQFLGEALPENSHLYLGSPDECVHACRGSGRQILWGKASGPAWPGLSSSLTATPRGPTPTQPCKSPWEPLTCTASSHQDISASTRVPDGLFEGRNRHSSCHHLGKGTPGPSPVCHGQRSRPHSPNPEGLMQVHLHSAFRKRFSW